MLTKLFNLYIHVYMKINLHGTVVLPAAIAINICSRIYNVILTERNIQYQCLKPSPLQPCRLSTWQPHPSTPMPHDIRIHGGW